MCIKNWCNGSNKDGLAWLFVWYRIHEYAVQVVVQLQVHIITSPGAQTIYPALHITILTCYFFKPQMRSFHPLIQKLNMSCSTLQTLYIRRNQDLFHTIKE